jgi:16S rRNA (adenine1518-N6/adenine1519-N6)-dimethyltransferase
MDNLPPLREVINTHGLQARKSLGQNFLLDLNLTRRIAREAGVQAGVQVYEVGPGPGGLTRALLAEGADHVLAIEKDNRCLAALSEVADAYPGRLDVIEQDALQVDEATALAGSPNQSEAPCIIVANLPYNVSAVLLTKWLQADPWPPWFQSLTLMFQKEVADRITAKPGSKAYGRLSVLSNWRTSPRRLFDVSPQAFVPTPKIVSTVVRFDVRKKPVAPADVNALQAATAAAFGQRRKMIRSSLKSLGVSVEALLDAAEIEPTLRAETLSVEQYCALARAYVALK